MTGVDRRMSLSLQAAIVAGGITGALLRGGLDAAFHWNGRGWPWAIFAVNLAGTFVLGYLVTRLQERLPPSTFRRPFLATGFCGAFTTFSTFQLEILELVHHGRLALAAAYLAASVVAGLAGIQLATAFSRRVRLV